MISRIGALMFFLLASYTSSTQNTVGLISLEKDQTASGYNLFFPHNQSSVYLTNECGEIVHVWEDEDPMFRPGNMAYLLEDGTLVRCKRPNNPTMDSIWAGGGGAFVELVDWDGNVTWSFFQNDSLARLHHDVSPLPNGNILMISWELKTGAEAIQAGRDTSSLQQNKLWPDYILEMDPDTDSIVWEWHVWDHLVQEFDSTKDNFGKVSDHPELVDINWVTNDGFPDWMHSNALDYNEELDQIMLCVPAFHEFWVIDHSTTTEEARGHSGGNSGKGGDLLYRWGNPQTYGGEGQQRLFWPHDAHWVDQFLDPSHPEYGKIAVFNNRVGPDYSTANIMTPSYNLTTSSYQMDENSQFLPTDFSLVLTHPDTFSIHSTGLSSVQVLRNKNLLICSGRFGRVFEINPATGNVVWEYRVPLKGGSPVSQGDTLVVNNNLTFRFTRYPLDYPGFEGRDLTPIKYLENEPNLTFCDLVTSSEDFEVSTVSIFPNPAREHIQIISEKAMNQEVHLVDIQGRVVLRSFLSSTTSRIDLSSIKVGTYFLVIQGMPTHMVVIH